VKTSIIIAAALVAGTLSAQSPSAQSGKRVQIFGEFSRPQQITIGQVNGGDVKDQADNQLGGGIRFMGEMPGTSNWYFEIGGKLESSSKMGFNQTIAGTSPALNINTTNVNVRHSYWELGGAYLWDLGPGFSLGAHLDLRSETMDASGHIVVSPATYGGSGNVSQRLSFVRPWLRISGDFSFGKGAVTPYLGLDAAFTPIKTSQTEVVSLIGIDERTVKAMAPQFGASIYFGLKF
jgi:hypothetical protein